ncbi:gamma-glutamyltranspeptidase 1 [Tanacetum coccineum]
MSVPGEMAGLYKAWLQHGRIPWKTLFQPAISLAKDGIIVAPYHANSLAAYAAGIKKDSGLQKVYAPNGKFYRRVKREKLIKDVRSAGGILTMEDLRNYEVKVTDAVEVLNILNSYENTNDAKGLLGLHRFIEALKHMFALRMNLGDPDFVDISKTASEMLSPSFAKKIRQRIFDNTTFPSEYYMPGWSQIEDHGTSHFCIVDADRNAVSMTTTVNFPWGGGILSPTTGIVLNNQMGDFSAPTEISPDNLPPSPTNFISPNKRPLSSMTPVIIVKGDQLVGVIGGSGGIYIIPAVIQVFLNHFILGMEPLDAVQSPRVYHKLMPNVVDYENWTVIDGDHIELSCDRKKSLRKRGHVLQSKSGGAVSQLIVQTLKKPIENRRVSYNHKQVLKGMLTAISDPRRGGRPAAYARSLWKAIKARFGGNEASKKMQKNLLKQQFETFTIGSREELDSAYERFQHILSMLELHDATCILIKALVATDNNEDIDWTKEFDAEPVTYAMMALTGVEQDDWSIEFDAEHMHFGQDGLDDFDWSNKVDDAPVSLALMATNSEVPYCSKCSKFGIESSNSMESDISSGDETLTDSTYENFKREKAYKAVPPPTGTIIPPRANGNPEEDLKDYAIIDSGCSGSMTGDKDKLSDFKEFKGGYVAFGNDSKGGRISGKGTIKVVTIGMMNP